MRDDDVIFEQTESVIKALLDRAESAEAEIVRLREVLKVIGAVGDYQYLSSFSANQIARRALRPSK